MICLWKKQPSWLDEQFIMLHSVMELVEVLPVVCFLHPIHKKKETHNSQLAFRHLSVVCLFHGLSVFCHCNSWIVSVYHVGPDGWKKLSGDDVGELHYHYYPAEVAAVDHEMTEVPVA